MQKMLAVVLMLLGLSSTAFAQTAIHLYNDPSGWAAQSNSIPPSPPAYNPAYNNAPPNTANYLIAELGNDDTFGNLTHVTQGGTQKWTETTTPDAWATATIFFNSGKYYVTTSEDGSTLACTLSDGSTPHEYDYNLGPDNSITATNVAPAIGAGYSPGSFPTFDELSSLTVTGQVIFNSVSQTVTPSPCAVNHIGASYSFNLYNPNTRPTQDISYSLQLGHFCLPGSDYTNCSHTQIAPQWYTISGIAAVVDTPSAFSTGLTFVPTGGSSGPGPLTGPGTVTLTSTDFLSRLKTIIGNNPEGYDKNYKDWKITGFGYGTNMWGDSAINISWSSLNIAAACFTTTNCSSTPP